MFPALRRKLEAKKALDERSHPPLKETVNVPAPTALLETLEVPHAMDAGTDGFPQLPPVEEMLGGAALTLKTVNTQASDITSLMATAQKKSELSLSKQKTAYEGNLKKQELKNQDVATNNAHILSEIGTLKKANDDIRRKADDVRKQNEVLRSALHSLESQMGLAMGFVKNALGGKEDEKPVAASLLQMSSKVTHSSVSESSADIEADALSQADSEDAPDSILSELSKDIATLEKQRKQGAANLRSLFIRDYRAGAQRHLALLNQQKILTSRRSNLIELQSKLKRSLTHLEDNHTKLNHTLRGVSKFMHQLSHVASAPENDIPRLMKSLDLGVKTGLQWS